MNTFFIVIGCMVVADLIPRTFFQQIQWVKKKLNKRRLKPFDCEACLSFWLTLSVSLFLGTGIIVSILCSFSAFWLMCRYQMYKFKTNSE